mmetsp:Transcript_75185/g.135435  ORF Transcript_75185/g.135435 Transcript_75185/m.135435 type:complete len:276 (+) Transcript_75185:747-1574(+)
MQQKNLVASMVQGPISQAGGSHEFLLGIPQGRFDSLSTRTASAEILETLLTLGVGDTPGTLDMKVVVRGRSFAVIPASAKLCAEWNVKELLKLTPRDLIYDVLHAAGRLGCRRRCGCCISEEIKLVTAHALVVPPACVAFVVRCCDDLHLDRFLALAALVAWTEVWRPLRRLRRLPIFGLPLEKRAATATGAGTPPIRSVRVLRRARNHHRGRHSTPTWRSRGGEGRADLVGPGELVALPLRTAPVVLPCVSAGRAGGLLDAGPRMAAETKWSLH